jgi:NodT family efflux transporter outer membrane factor (OMF) lipoprotein
MARVSPFPTLTGRAAAPSSLRGEQKILGCVFSPLGETLGRLHEMAGGYVVGQSDAIRFEMRSSLANRGCRSTMCGAVARALLAGALFAGPGCAGAKSPVPAVALPAHYEAAAGSSLAPIALDRWWLLFNDPALDALEDEALAHAPDARTAAARLLEAKAAHDSAIAQTLPTGEGQGNISHQRAANIGGASQSLFPIGGTTDTATANLNVSWELDLFGRLAQSRRNARYDLAAARFDVEGTRASLVASVADDYFQVAGLIIQIADARETVRIQASLATVARKKAALGLGAAADADRVAGDLAQASAQAEDLEAQLHAMQRQLLILIGRGAAPIASLTVQPLAAVAPPVPAAIPGDLLQRRPDVRESEARLRSEAGTARLRHLAIFPTFTLLPGLGLSHTVSPGVSFIPPATLAPAQQTTDLGVWSLGAGVSVPLLDIPRLLYDAKAEDARTREAAIAYEQTVQNAYGDAESALVNLAAGKRAVAILDDGEARARRASDAAAMRYRLGFDDLTTALSAETAWRGTRSALTAERVATLRRAVQTYKALGGGWAFAASGSGGGARTP